MMTRPSSLWRGWSDVQSPTNDLFAHRSSGTFVALKSPRIYPSFGRTSMPRSLDTLVTPEVGLVSRIIMKS
jgi:hypothetical protein